MAADLFHWLLLNCVVLEDNLMVFRGRNEEGCSSPIVLLYLGCITI